MNRKLIHSIQILYTLEYHELRLSIYVYVLSILTTWLLFSGISCVVPKGEWLQRLGLGQSINYVGTKDNICIRIPNCAPLAYIVSMAGPVAITSANISGGEDSIHHNMVVNTIGMTVDTLGMNDSIHAHVHLRYNSEHIRNGYIYIFGREQDKTINTIDMTAITLGMNECLHSLESGMRVNTLIMRVNKLRMDVLNNMVMNIIGMTANTLEMDIFKYMYKVIDTI